MQSLTFWLFTQFIVVLIYEKNYIFCTLLILLPTFASASECTDFLTEFYTKSYNETITVFADRNESVDKYEDYINNQYISSIIYGKGYLKPADKRRKRITYICTAKDYKTMTWGYILPR